MPHGAKGMIMGNPQDAQQPSADDGQDQAGQDQAGQEPAQPDAPDQKTGGDDPGVKFQG